MELILLALVRKLGYIVLLWLVYHLFDHTELKGFDTRDLLKQNPLAVAVLLAGLAIAIALS